MQRGLPWPERSRGFTRSIGAESEFSGGASLAGWDTRRWVAGHVRLRFALGTRSSEVGPGDLGSGVHAG